MARAGDVIVRHALAAHPGVAALLLVLSFAALPENAVGAQVWTPGGQRPRPSTLRPELRLDYIGGAPSALHLGAGLSARAGNYVRVGGNIGVAPGPLGGAGNRAHVDLTARFMLDPYRQARFGASLGGGVSVRYQDERARAFALLVADLETGRTRRWSPFFRIGLGGGPRLTVGVRRGSPTGR